MYIGTYYHTVEEKGRISLPVKFREQLGSCPVITRGLDGCLFVFSQQTWQEFSNTLLSASLTKRAQREFVRLMANEAVELEIDAQGRALVPEYLRTAAGLKKYVVFTGSGSRVELWDRDAYHTYMKQLEQRAEDVAESFEVETT